MPYRFRLDTRFRRLAAFSLFYLSEGLPVGFSTVALAAYLRAQGASITSVGALTAAVYAPWGFKFAWAPFVDLVNIRRWGHSRAWIVACQTMMILTMAALFTFDITNTGLLMTLMIVHNTFAATQDVAIDAMAVRTVPPNEMGTANGFMFGAQFLGIGLGGSGALYVSQWLGFRAALIFLLLCMTALLVGVTLPLEEPAEPMEARRSGSLANAVITRLGTFVRELKIGLFGRGIGPLAGVVLTLLPTGAMALTLATATVIQVDMKMSQQQIGTVAMITNIAGAAASLLGGWISDRTGSPRATTAAAYAGACLVAVLFALRFPEMGVAGVTVTAFVVAATAQTFFYGVQQGAQTGLLMQLSNPAVAATQFTGYMALHNVTIAYMSAWHGRIADSRGYRATLALDALVGLVGVVVLPWVRAQTRSKMDLNPVHE